MEENMPRRIIRDNTIFTAKRNFGKLAVYEVIFTKERKTSWP